MNQLRWRALKFVEMLENLYWDRKLGIKTNYKVPVHEMSYLGNDILNARAYEPTPYRTLFSAFSLCEIEDYENYDFIDYGCGAGRATVFASNLGFRKSIGVDFDPSLIDQAQKNLKSYKEKGFGLSNDIEFVCQSVTEFEMNRKKTVHYFYNPFDSKILGNVLARLVESGSLKREDIIVYVNPMREYLLGLHGFRKVRSVKHWNHNRNIVVYRGCDLINTLETWPEMSVNNVPEVKSWEGRPFQ